MISEAEQKGTLKPGDTLIEATSGNTGATQNTRSAQCCDMLHSCQCEESESISVDPVSETRSNHHVMGAAGIALAMAAAIKGYPIKLIMCVLCLVPCWRRCL